MGEGIDAVNAFYLRVSLGHKSYLVSLNGPIAVVFDLKHPFVASRFLRIG
ncbi:hypothetical protein Lalb_Chr12g0206211 [Lupinus albus]|uniref:Uncharacterized protein n=1 Tax=Lupinus albus TaxID=3870 RepID=A0A6A4PN70_LUPAL|nr:hypothetical protein Lalb_Chr12g0206211 [Lupinus albus]